MCSRFAAGQTAALSAQRLLPPLPPRRDSQADQDAMVDYLRQGQYQALVLDAPLMQFYAATDPLCQLYTVGDIFDTFTQGLAFPNSMDDVAIREWNGWAHAAGGFAAASVCCACTHTHTLHTHTHTHSAGMPLRNRPRW